MGPWLRAAAKEREELRRSFWANKGETRKHGLSGIEGINPAQAQGLGHFS